LSCLCFLGFMIYLYAFVFCFTFSHFPSGFGAGLTNLNEPPSSFFSLPITAGWELDPLL